MVAERNYDLIYVMMNVDDVNPSNLPPVIMWILAMGDKSRPSIQTAFSISHVDSGDGETHDFSFYQFFQLSCVSFQLECMRLNQ